MQDVLGTLGFKRDGKRKMAALDRGRVLLSNLMPMLHAALDLIFIARILPRIYGTSTAI
jgi:hypothetical protein